MLRVTAAGVWELDLDGVTLVTSTVGPVDGTWQQIDVRWSTDGFIVLRIDGEDFVAVYAGTIQNAGTWQLELDGAEMAIRDFMTVRNGS